MRRLRIEREQIGDSTVIRISGQLVAAALDELEVECRSATASLVLELSDLRQADEESLAFLRRRAAEGVQLQGASPYLALLLGL